MSEIKHLVKRGFDTRIRQPSRLYPSSWLHRSLPARLPARALSCSCHLNVLASRTALITKPILLLIIPRRLHPSSQRNQSHTPHLRKPGRYSLQPTRLAASISQLLPHLPPDIHLRIDRPHGDTDTLPITPFQPPRGAFAPNIAM